ncbi:hypothetical protein FVE85_7814 [Porphyridium purpureum]|uniref:Uncharacterized protein n=1 Tax=Porphyridium purpureum TaxID=35688 RepID=A0A5J4YL82_PORPP|nr:hypothetical protein FVE85_7814 [Porphyridium purpureum]|eukprot:POR6659..scf210_14
MKKLQQKLATGKHRRSASMSRESVGVAAEGSGINKDARYGHGSAQNSSAASFLSRIKFTKRSLRSVIKRSGILSAVRMNQGAGADKGSDADDSQMNAAPGKGDRKYNGGKYTGNGHGADGNHHLGMSWNTDNFRESQNIFYNDDLDIAKLQVPKNQFMQYDSLVRGTQRMRSSTDSNGTEQQHLMRSVRFDREENYAQEDEKRLVRVARLANRASRGSAEAGTAMCALLVEQISSVERYIAHVRTLMYESSQVVNELPEKPPLMMSSHAAPGQPSAGKQASTALPAAKSISPLLLEEENTAFQRTMAMQRKLWEVEAAMKQGKFRTAIGIVEELKKSKSFVDDPGRVDKLDELTGEMVELLKQRSRRRLRHMQNCQQFVSGVGSGGRASTHPNALHVQDAKYLLRLARVEDARDEIFAFASARLSASLQKYGGGGDSASLENQNQSSAHQHGVEGVMRELFVQITATYIEVESVLDPQIAREAAVLMMNPWTSGAMSSAFGVQQSQHDGANAMARRLSSAATGINMSGAGAGGSAVDALALNVAGNCRIGAAASVAPAVLTPDEAEQQAHATWQLFLWMMVELQNAFERYLVPKLGGRNNNAPKPSLAILARLQAQLKNAFLDTEHARVTEFLEPWASAGIAPGVAAYLSAATRRTNEKRIQEKLAQVSALCFARISLYLEPSIIDAFEAECAGLVAKSTRLIKEDSGELRLTPVHELYQGTFLSSERSQLSSSASSAVASCELSASCASLVKAVLKIAQCSVEFVQTNAVYYPYFISCIAKPLETYVSYIGQSQLKDSVVRLNLLALGRTFVPTLIHWLTETLDYAVPEVDMVLQGIGDQTGLDVAKRSTGAGLTAASSASTISASSSSSLLVRKSTSAVVRRKMGAAAAGLISPARTRPPAPASSAAQLPLGKASEVNAATTQPRIRHVRRGSIDDDFTLAMQQPRDAALASHDKSAKAKQQVDIDMIRRKLQHFRSSGD